MECENPINDTFSFWEGCDNENTIGDFMIEEMAPQIMRSIMEESNTNQMNKLFTDEEINSQCQNLSVCPQKNSSSMAEEATKEKIAKPFFNETAIKSTKMQTLKSYPRIVGPKRGPRTTITDQTRNRLLNWLSKHHKHPYPTYKEKSEMCQMYKIDKRTLETFLINNRRRYLR